MERKVLGKYIASLGFITFMCLFWLPFGFYLGGDPYFFGPFNAELLLTFPYAGVGIFLLFMGIFLQGKFRNISENRLLYFLIFLMVVGVSSNFSIAPHFSILFLILWSIGFFGVVFNTVFWGDERWKQFVTLSGVIFGSVLAYYYPEWQISTDLIAIVSIYLMIFMKVSKNNLGEVTYLPLFGAIAMSQNIGLIIFSGLLWVTMPWWMTRRQKQDIDVWHWVLFFIFLTCVILFYERPTMMLQSWAMPWFSDWKTFVVGLGEGQLTTALYNFSPIHILGNMPIATTSGIVKTFFEQGIVGVVLIIFLAINPFFFHQKKLVMPIVLFLCFWILSIDFLGTTNGILLAMMFLFMRNPKIK